MSKFIIRKPKAIFIIVVMIISLLLLNSYGWFALGPTSYEERWLGGTCKYGVPGGIVNFNRSVEVIGGRYVRQVAITISESEWEVNVYPNRITVEPGESKNITVEVTIPENAEIGQVSRIVYEVSTMIIPSNYNERGGRRWTPLHVEVTDEIPMDNSSPRNFGGSCYSEEELYADGTLNGIDYWRVAASAYFIAFLPFLILYIFPNVRKIRSKKK